MPAEIRSGRLPYPRTGEEFHAFLKAYFEKRDCNIRHNTGEGTSLHLLGATTFDYHPSDMYSVSIPSKTSETATCNAHESISELPRRRPRVSWDVRPFESKINLIRNLTPLIGHRAQVWVATVDAHPETVVVKIYHDCLVEEKPLWMEWPSSKHDVTNYWPIEEISHREAWAYGKLVDFQGSLFPHSYGFYDVILPSGDQTSVHILEHLSGTPMDVYSEQDEFPCLSMEGDRKPFLKAVIRNMMQAVLISQRADILQKDIYERNFIIPDDTSGGYSSAVMLDFGDAKSFLDNPESRSRDRLWALLIMQKYLGPGCMDPWILEETGRAKVVGDEYNQGFWTEMLIWFNRLFHARSNT